MRVCLEIPRGLAARLVSRELEIVLTGREMGKGNRVPPAGISRDLPVETKDQFAHVSKMVDLGPGARRALAAGVVNRTRLPR
jgi:hypothetical protein